MTASTEKTRKAKLPASEKQPVKSLATSVLSQSRKASQNGASKTLRVADVRGRYTVKRAKKVLGESAVLPLARPAAKGGADLAPVTLFDRMGLLLDQPLRSESDVVRLVDAGLPAAAFTHLTRALKIDHDLIAPESTVRRRVQDKKRFTTDESERMVRIARVHALASELFGDDDAARGWLNAPRAYVPGAAAIAPYKLAVTDAGARLVEELLLRTAHGVF